MDLIVENPILYGLAIFFIVYSSLYMCGKLNPQRITAERAFWAVWVFLIISAETVTNFSFFEYPYPIDSLTRKYTIEMFLACAAGFVWATFIYRYATKKNKNTDVDNVSNQKWLILNSRPKYIISLFFLIVGIAEFFVNYRVYGNLLALREGALEGAHESFQVFSYIFYFSNSYLLLLGYVDGRRSTISKEAFYMTVVGLVFHNLSIGGRINIVVAPIFYIVSYLLCFDGVRNYRRDIYVRSRRYFVKLMIFVFVTFSFVGLMRSLVVDFSSIATISGFLNKIIFGIPKYVSDSYVSISVHSRHALSHEPLLGKFTFDALYRVLLKFNIVDPVSPNVFGHSYYQDTGAPWGWTQTNVIPRMLADFGENLFVIGFAVIAFFSQWISISLPRRSFLKHSIATMAIISSLYTIQASMWFSAYTVIIIIFCIIVGYVNKLLKKIA